MVFLQTPNASGDQVRALVKSIPAEPKRIAIWFSHPFVISNYYQLGVVLRNSSSGAMVTWGWVNRGSSQLSVDKFNSPSSYNANYSQSAPMAVACAGTGLAIRLGSATRYFEYSTDGLNWIPFYSVSNTDFITPDQVGLYVNASGNGTPVSMSLLSYQEM
jgi:hypothetical protein